MINARMKLLQDAVTKVFQHMAAGTDLFLDHLRILEMAGLLRVYTWHASVHIIGRVAAVTIIQKSTREISKFISQGVSGDSRRAISA